MDLMGFSYPVRSIYDNWELKVEISHNLLD